jgi:threonine dehydrogenase-like Zn-dependent dehydrogenase
MEASEARQKERDFLRWTHRGEPLDVLLRSFPETLPLSPPAPGEVIARVEAVSICSSDIKVVRLGLEHPLLAHSQNSGYTVLGHEVSLRVEQVGALQRDRFHPGQRLGLQPAMRIDGKRKTIGFDVPGGFAQFLRLGPDALEDYVFEVPENLTAAEIALLEPYGCVERAYRPNARQTFAMQGSALVVLGPGYQQFTASQPQKWRRTVLVGPLEATMPSGFDAIDHHVTSLDELEDERFEDVIVLGELEAEKLARLPDRMREGGLLLQARHTPTDRVPVDAARIHYEALSFIGTASSDILDALKLDRQRFDVKPGGTALVHGAGGAMGRIHVHRLLQLENGPSTVIATSRSQHRQDDLEADFAPLARKQGKRLVIVASGDVEAAIKSETAHGLDDAVVVVPDPAAVAEAADWLAPGGLLAVFAGFAFGSPVLLDLAGVAVSGKRFTGSTGCSVDDMKDVLARVERGELDLLANLKAVGGLRQLPRALEAVDRGEVSGKIVLYPQAPDSPFHRLEENWDSRQERALLGPPENQRIPGD